MSSVKKARDEVHGLVQHIREDRKQLNGILKLLANVANLDDEDDKVAVAKAVASLRGCTELFQTFIARGDLDEANAGRLEGEESASGQVQAWLKERLDELWSHLCQILAERDCQGLVELALPAAFRLILGEHTRAEEIQGHLDHWLGGEVKRLRSLLVALCSKSRCCSDRIRKLKEHLELTDVKQHVIQGLNKLVKSQQQKGEEPAQQFKRNVITFVEIVDFKEPNKVSKTFLGSLSDAGSGGSRLTYDHEPVRKAFSDLWEMIVKWRLDAELYRRILLILDAKVMPHLTRPLLLTDFLISSYDVGGGISVLALGGVFALIQKYNLEYPDFYAKLYALFTPEVVHAKYRARFLYMSDLFLTSSHLPEYLVASFVKRTARLALFAPAPAILALLPFIGNLLFRHKGLSRMLKLTSEREEDPYLPEEKDPAKSGAANSCLWELSTLSQHASPQVSKAARDLAAKMPEEEKDLGNYLELNYGDMMKIEAKKKVFSNVQLTFEMPNELAFSKDDVTSQYFCL